MEGPRRHTTSQRMVAISAAAVFAAATALDAWCLVLTWDPLPYWDHWETVEDFQHFLRHGLDWGRLFAQHNEHRIFFSKLLNLADYLWFGGAGLFLVGFNVVASCAIVALLLRFSGARRVGMTGVPAFLFCIAAGASVAQIGNLAFAFQTAWYLVALFAMLGIRAYQQAIDEAVGGSDRWRRLGWLAAAWILAAAATFSIASGTIAWIALLATGLMMRQSIRGLFATGLMGAAVSAMYFRGYHAPGGHSSISGALHDPVAVLGFCAVYAANALQQIGPLQQVVVGSAAMLFTGGHILAFAARPGAADRHRVYTGAVSTFLIGTIGMTALGRVSTAGPFGANATRYVTYGLLLLVCAVLLTVGGRPVPGRRTTLLLGALGVLVAAVTWSGFTGPPLQQALTFKRGRLAVRLCDRVGACTAADYGAVYPDIPAAEELMRFLREHRLSVFAPDFAPQVSARALASETNLTSLPSCVGSIDVVDRSPDGILVAHGWMVWPGTHTRPVHVSVYTPDGALVGGGGFVEPRTDVQRSLGVAMPGEWRSYGFVAWWRGDDASVVFVGTFRHGAERCKLLRRTGAERR